LSNSLRWVLVLPAAIGGYVAVIVVLVMMAWIGGFGIPGDPAAPQASRWYMKLFSTMLSSYAFVTSGSAVAPAHWLAVAVSLTVLHAAYVAHAVATTKSSESPAWIAVQALVAIAATIGGCWTVFNNRDRGMHTAASPAPIEDAPIPMEHSAPSPGRVEIPCPNCGQWLRVLVGKRGNILCPTCSQSFAANT
jgi:hypothetical protein